MYSHDMRERITQQNTTLPNTTMTATTVSSSTKDGQRRHLQNFLLIRLDPAIDQTNKDWHHTLAQLRNIVDDVHLFTQCDECVDFLTDIVDKRVFLVVEGVLGEKLLPLIHDIPQLHTIYILYGNKTSCEEWVKTWVKVKGIHTETTPLSETLQHAVKQFDHDSIPVSFVAADEDVSTINLNQLDPLFMYTQIFKEILLEMHYDQHSIKNFATYCRNGDSGSPVIITRFENEYKPELAVWWYTYPSFIYSFLNYALRTMEADSIINMGFFIRDLHRQIEQLYQTQVNSYHGQSFTVYRGQGLSTNDYEKLRKTTGGLISFNNFLSTSRDREVSLIYAATALTNTDTVGILFRMSIDPSLSSTPFAVIRDVSYYETEEEILFSMHTIFRIGEITSINDHSPLYQVELQLTLDDDPQLRTLTKRIREEIPVSTGWQRLGLLLLKTSQFIKSEEIYNELLEQTSDESEKAYYYNQLAYVKHDQGDYEKAIWYCEKALEIFEKTLSPDHRYLATS